jgi:hypothetical protein
VEYQDDYGTCDETYVTLRVYPGEITPTEVTERLGLEPSETQTRGAVVTNKRGRTRTVKLHGWFLTSKGEVESRDARRHLDWLFARLAPVEEALHALQNTPGVRIDISCGWWSAHGHGGPAVSPKQAQQLAALRLELWFDVYFLGDDIGEALQRAAEAREPGIERLTRLRVVQPEDDTDV